MNKKVELDAYKSLFNGMARGIKQVLLKHLRYLMS